MNRRVFRFPSFLRWIGVGWVLGTVFCSQGVLAEPTDAEAKKAASLPVGWAEKLFDRKTYDFGRVPAGAQAEFEFSITNIYPLEVEISRIRETCECTEPILAKSVLAPGEQTTLTARLQTHRFQGRKGATLTITFVRPEFAEVQLHVTAYIDPAVSLSPAELDFGVVQPGQQAQKEAELRCRGRPDWRIEAVQPPPKGIAAKISEIERNDQVVRYRLQVQWTPTGPLGPFKEVLTLKTNDPGTSEIFLLLTGQAAAEVEAHPPRVWLGAVQPGQAAAKLLILRASRPFAIQAATANLAGLTIDFQGGKGAQTIHRLTVRYQAPASPGKYVGVIRIQTDLNQHPLEIPVQAVVFPSPENQP